MMEDQVPSGAVIRDLSSKADRVQWVMDELERLYPEVPVPLRRATTAAALLVLLQVGLGITTLLLRVPVALAVFHQITGLAVFTAVLLAAHQSTGPSRQVDAS